jgi:hypothetical protein
VERDTRLTQQNRRCGVELADPIGASAGSPWSEQEEALTFESGYKVGSLEDHLHDIIRPDFDLGRSAFW